MLDASAEIGDVDGVNVPEYSADVLTRTLLSRPMNLLVTDPAVAVVIPPISSGDVPAERTVPEKVAVPADTPSTYTTMLFPERTAAMWCQLPTDGVVKVTLFSPPLPICVHCISELLFA